MQNIIKVELFSWMQQVKAVNTNQSYYMIGQVRGMDKTLMVTPVGGNGGAVMFCQIHSFAYSINHGSCTECQNAPRDEAIEAGVTACYTPEIEQETERR